MRNYQRYLWVSLVTLALLASGCTRFGGGSRSDMQVASDVQSRINSDGTVPDKITVNANNGVVTLTGNVSSDAARTAAVNDASHIDGVKTVVDRMQIAPSTAANMPAPEPQIEQASNNNQAAAPAPTPRERPSPRQRKSRNTAANSVNDYNNTSSGLGTTVPPDNANTVTQPAAPPAPVTPPPPQKITIPSGTQLSIRLNQELDSEKAQVGDVFKGSLSAPVTLDDQTVIPTTADVEGRVVDVKSAGRFAGQSVLTLQLTRLLMNGRSYGIQTNQWSKSGNGRGKSTATKVGGGAAVGAILGGIFGGGKGAAIGAAAGAGAGTGVSAATKGQQILLKPESVIGFTLENPLTVTPGPGRAPMGQQGPSM
jgi:hypothetical protein